MNMTLSSFAALVLFGSFAARSGAFASTNDGAGFAANVNSQTIESHTVERLEMSEEERTRREVVCETALEACFDWCTRTKGSAPCRSECMEKYAACLKKIRDPD